LVFTVKTKLNRTVLSIAKPHAVLLCAQIGLHVVESARQWPAWNAMIRSGTQSMKLLEIMAFRARQEVRIAG
jgi:hypothetical protein